MARRDSVRDLSDVELVARLDEGKATLFNLRFQLATGQEESYSRVKAVKKDIARSLTELRAREIAAAEALQSEEG